MTERLSIGRELTKQLPHAIRLTSLKNNPMAHLSTTLRLSQTTPMHELTNNAMRLLYLTNLTGVRAREGLQKSS